MGRSCYQARKHGNLVLGQVEAAGIASEGSETVTPWTTFGSDLMLSGLKIEWDFRKVCTVLHRRQTI